MQGKLHGLHHFCLQLMIVHGCCYLQGLVEAESCSDWEATFNTISLATLAVLEHSCRSSFYLSLFHSAASSIVVSKGTVSSWEEWRPVPSFKRPGLVGCLCKRRRLGSNRDGYSGPLWLVDESLCGCKYTHTELQRLHHGTCCSVCSGGQVDSGLGCATASCNQSSGRSLESAASSTIKWTLVLWGRVSNQREMPPWITSCLYSFSHLLLFGWQ